ncbi:hypothetical protein [Paenibacillus macquariensis]|uniref:Uncharacterized protein n=1 Tax=Paenibacillus macquariensis TaxID=948756 RepID=A0ABY1KEY6_9BACL|nr:hypothetical protein [Paenibacillus macquariensis]OAB29598.1 hypothetical protein PMSM_23730 [Paenibacillus macquariensis subsp. macquariensis]SIR73609.1 hypothetical protein SAMN05421578_1535 [Paenibacillus macquariensis]
MKESDMYTHVSHVLLEIVKCDNVYAEVSNFDVVAVKNNISLIVEMKKQLNFKVIEQAITAKHCADYIFIAVPKPKQYHSKIALNLLKQEGIGLIYTTDERKEYDSRTNGSTIQFWGKRVRRKTYDIQKQINHEFHSRTVGGVKSGEGITEYSEMIDAIKLFLKRKDWVTVDQILENIQTYYSNPKSSLMQTLKSEWNSDWLEWKVENRKTHFRLRIAA